MRATLVFGAAQRFASLSVLLGMHAFYTDALGSVLTDPPLQAGTNSSRAAHLTGDLAGSSVVGAEAKANLLGQGLPAPWRTADIGSVAITGSASFSNSTFVVAGSGGDIWETEDAFRYVCRGAGGDEEIVAKVESVQNTHPWAKAGLMIRETMAADAASAGVFVTPSNGVSFQWRTSPGAPTVNVYRTGLGVPCWVKLTQTSNSFRAYYSMDGTNWTGLGAAQRTVTTSSLTLGMAVTSHSNGTNCTATFSHVRTGPPEKAVLRNITEIRQFLGLTGDAACEGHLARLEGWVVSTDPIQGEILLQDTTGVLRVKVDLAAQPVKPGQWVVVEGTTSAAQVRYPDFPSGRHYLTSFEGPSNVDDNYLARIRGYLHPSRTGDYTLWIASDDNSQLWLSSDDQPERARKIAWVEPIHSFTGLREWDKYPSQRSSRIWLEAGRKYYIMALHYEITEDDHVEVAWEGPGIVRSVITGQFLSPWIINRNGDGDGTKPPATGAILREYWLSCPVENLGELATNALSRAGQPFILQPRLTVLRNRSLPEPRPLDLERSVAPEQDYAWVETEGRVSYEATDGGGWSVLELVTKDHCLTLRVSNPERKKTLGLVNARVRVRGFCQNIVDQRGNRGPGVLWIPRLEQVSLLQPSEEDWSHSQVIPLQRITQPDRPIHEGQRIRVRGRVSGQDPGRSVSLREATSEFAGFVSQDGSHWVQVGETINIAMDQSIYVGLAYAGVGTEDPNPSTATFDQVTGVSPAWTNSDLGNPAFPGSVTTKGATYSILGRGDLRRGPSDTFHYLYQRMEGNGMIIARVNSADLPSGWSKAGVMMRESLSSDSKYACMGAVIEAEGGTQFAFRPGTGRNCEAAMLHQPLPCWVKLTRRRSGDLVVRSRQSLPMPLEQSIEAMGVLERTNDAWMLDQAFYRVAVSPAEEQPQAVISRVEQIRQLSGEALTRHAPAKIRGVITAKPDELYVQDATGGIRVPRAYWQRFGHCEPGQFVEVAGRCASGGYSPELELSGADDHITVAGLGQMPQPLPSTWNQLMSGKHDGQWVEVEGVVRSIAGKKLGLVSAGGWIPGALSFEFSASDFRRLVDATVRVRGVCSIVADEKKQVMGFSLIVPLPECVSAVEPALTDPFNASAYAIGDLAKYKAQNQLLHRVRVEGWVTCQRGRGFFLEDTTGGLKVETQGVETVQQGDRVEVVGFPELNDYSPLLTGSLIRKVGKGILPPPAHRTMSELLTGRYDAQRVRVEALFLGQKTEGSNQVLEFLADRRSFRAILGTDAGTLASVPPGSRVEISGVFKADAGNLHSSGEGVSSFQLHLASAREVVVRERPPWWTWKHSALTVSLLGIALGGAFGWIRLLRKTVEKRTSELRSQIDQRKKAEVEVERIHRELLVASRQAGMADVATSVLHNVGNVLNSVNTSATLVAEKARHSKSASVAQVAALLNEHTADLAAFLTQDGKGRQIPKYLTLLSESFAGEEREVRQELASLRDNIEHIKEIVAMQQDYARGSGVVETVAVRVLVEDALKIHSEAYLRHAVRLQQEYEELPPITTEGHKVLNILVNLFHNAKNACDEGGRADKQVKVRVAGSGEHRVTIEVTDNGIGIPAENLTSIFNPGLSTRKDGHGFGLHSGANAAKELGGSLTAHSEGPGKGATFVLELPIRCEQAERRHKTASLKS